jgi:Holliday junction resolvasome RuvABC endonuclease subunit
MFEQDRDVFGCIDLASIAGFSVFNLNGLLLESGSWAFEPGPHKGDRWLDFRSETSRLLSRYSGRMALLAMERPVLYGDPGKDWNTARVMFGQSALIELDAARLGIPTTMVSPSEIKMFVTGNGNAPKGEVIRAVERELGPLSTALEERTASDRKRSEKARSDEADARALGLYILGSFDMTRLRAGALVRLGDGR